MYPEDPHSDFITPPLATVAIATSSAAVQSKEEETLSKTGRIEKKL